MERKHSPLLNHPDVAPKRTCAKILMTEHSVLKFETSVFTGLIARAYRIPKKQSLCR